MLVFKCGGVWSEIVLAAANYFSCCGLVYLLILGVMCSESSCLFGKVFLGVAVWILQADFWPDDAVQIYSLKDLGAAFCWCVDSCCKVIST